MVFLTPFLCILYWFNEDFLFFGPFFWPFFVTFLSLFAVFVHFLVPFLPPIPYVWWFLTLFAVFWSFLVFLSLFVFFLVFVLFEFPRPFSPFLFYRVAFFPVVFRRAFFTFPDLHPWILTFWPFLTPFFVILKPINEKFLFFGVFWPFLAIFVTFWSFFLFSCFCPFLSFFGDFCHFWSFLVFFLFLVIFVTFVTFWVFLISCFPGVFFSSRYLVPRVFRPDSLFPGLLP